MLGEFIDDDAIKALFESAVAHFAGGDGGDDDPGGAGEGDDGPELCLDLEGIILAFAGKVLLRPTALKLIKGRRYGVVGQNGAGKTTLLTRLAAGDINGWPKDLRCVFVQHEVLVTLEDYLGLHDRAGRDPRRGSRGRPTVPRGSRLHSRSHGEDGDGTLRRLAHATGDRACDAAEGGPPSS